MDPFLTGQYSQTGMQYGVMGNANQQTNPWYNIANTFVPRNLTDVIKWARYITVQSPTTSEVARKYASYPITDFIVDTRSNRVKDEYKKIFKQLKLKEALQTIGFEYHMLGNAFLSIYFPVTRTITCPSCGAVHNVKNAKWVGFKKYEFFGTCPIPGCSYRGDFHRKDSKSMNPKDIHLVHWTAEHIVVNHNPITGESEYFYRIPASVKQKIQKGDTLFINSIPWELVEAVKNNQPDFKFDNDHVFHLRNLSTGGSVEGISVPPLLSLFSLVFYQATLRKANEAVATEHLNPLRVVFPQAQTANSDPAVNMSIRNFKNRMEEALLVHKRDKNHILVSPTPVGYQNIGGEGKNLLVSQELQQAEDTILLSLGVSRELLSGTCSWTSSSVGLRMMENMLTGYVSRLEELINWAMAKIAVYLNMEVSEVSMIPFKLLDDETLKGLLIQLASAAKISDTTLFEELGLDFTKEQERLVEEAGAKASTQILSQYEAEKCTYIAAKKSGDQMKKDEEFQSALTKAQQTAEELYQTEEGSRKKFLNQLKTADYAQWLMVAKLLDEMHDSAAHQQQNQAGAEQVAQQTDDGGAGSGAAQDPNGQAQAGGQGPQQ